MSNYIHQREDGEFHQYPLSPYPGPILNQPLPSSYGATTRMSQCPDAAHSMQLSRAYASLLASSIYQPWTVFLYGKTWSGLKVSLILLVRWSFTLEFDTGFYSSLWLWDKESLFNQQLQERNPIQGQREIRLLHAAMLWPHSTFSPWDYVPEWAHANCSRATISVWVLLLPLL